MSEQGAEHPPHQTDSPWSGTKGREHQQRVRRSLPSRRSKKTARNRRNGNKGGRTSWEGLVREGRSLLREGRQKGSPKSRRPPRGKSWDGRNDAAAAGTFDGEYAMKQRMRRKRRRRGLYTNEAGQPHPSDAGHGRRSHHLAVRFKMTSVPSYRSSPPREKSHVALCRQAQLMRPYRACFDLMEKICVIFEKI